jgi:anti-sigma regulatory factor (Ser/Thr protein kinase)
LDPILFLLHANTLAFGSDFAYQIELAASEIITNIIKHSYKQTEGSIHGEMQIEHDQVQIDLFDRGLSFDPASLPQDNDDLEPHAGGYGLTIVQKIMDQVVYTQPLHRETIGSW